MTITTRMEECGIRMDFAEDSVTLEDTFHSDGGVIKLNLKDLGIVEKMIAQWRRIKETN